MAALSHNILLTGDALRGEEAFRREWLVTNNLGGYASASVTTAIVSPSKVVNSTSYPLSS